MNRVCVSSIAVLVIALLVGCGDETPQPQVPEPGTTTAPAASGSETATPPATPAGDVEGGESSAAPQVQGMPGTTRASSTANAGGQLLKQSELKEKPFIDAKTVATLAAQAKVTILERSGGWYRVASTGKSGWLRMLDVKVTTGGESLGGSDLGSVANLATGRAGSGNVVSTSGLRGLNEEKLSSAKPDYGQLDKLDSYGVGKQAALDYAKKNGLKGRQLAYLPAVKR